MLTLTLIKVSEGRSLTFFYHYMNVLKCALSSSISDTVLRIIYLYTRTSILVILTCSEYILLKIC